MLRILGSAFWLRDGSVVSEQDEIDAIEKAITDAGGNVDVTKASGEEVIALGVVDGIQAALEPATYQVTCCESGNFDECGVRHNFHQWWIML
jgi:hypothetical protein